MTVPPINKLQGYMPASGPKLGSAIELALSQLNELAVRRDFDLTGKGWPPHAKVWLQLLTQSKQKMGRGVAPCLLKGDIAWPTGIALTGREWGRFQRWYERWIEPDLREIAVASKVKVLCAIRIADRKGGRPEQSEAIYFLAYADEQRVPQAGPSTVVTNINMGEGTASASSNESGSCSPTALTATAESDGIAGGTPPLSGLETPLFPTGPESLENGREVNNIPGQSRSAVDAHCAATAWSERASARWRFGVSMVLLGVFLLAFCNLLPQDAHRPMFVSFSLALFTLGLWDMDRGNKGVPR